MAAESWRDCVRPLVVTLELDLLVLPRPTVLQAEELTLAQSNHPYQCGRA